MNTRNNFDVMHSLCKWYKRVCTNPNHIKDRIFKYIDIIGLEYILNENTLKFTHPKEFNDPFEFHDGLVDRKINLKHWIQIVKERDKNLTKERLKQHIWIFKNDNDNSQDRINKQFEDRKNTSRISCFSELNDSLLMWSHYADKHKGVCIEFSTKELSANFKRDFQICNVEYSKKIRPKNISDYRDNAILHWINTKGEDWEYEKEIRMIFGSDPVEFQKINISSIKNITFGCKVKEEEKIRIENLIFGDQKYDWINTSEMNISKTEFKLELNKRH